MSTIHEHCSQGKKKRVQIFKICLVYDLKYEIFILELL